MKRILFVLLFALSFVCNSCSNEDFMGDLAGTVWLGYYSEEVPTEYDYTMTLYGRYELSFGKNSFTYQHAKIYIVNDDSNRLYENLQPGSSSYLGGGTGIYSYSYPNMTLDFSGNIIQAVIKNHTIVFTDDNNNEIVLIKQ
ncbi:hypothetical protein Barb7_01570 [Bacteroidales bacterium Barb7]|nr:hypothetical protein Barb7_01570 [Bacteroidales bacterium Barb7]